ncbi:MAG: hypothetical protein AAGB15_06165, partial [Pseudomonadota bacterium]
MPRSNHRSLVLCAAALVSSAALLGTAPPAEAAKTKEQICRDLAHQASRTLWDSFRKAADDTVCRKPWMQRSGEEFLACAAANKVRKVGNRVKDRWNRVFQAAGAGWAQWGPRTVSESWANGTIRGGFKRTFFT